MLIFHAYQLNKKVNLYSEIDAAFNKTDLEKAKGLLIKFKYFNHLENRIKELKTMFIE
jgi:HSCB C-terminal oligomerisation domain